MIILEHRIVRRESENFNEEYVKGYFLTIHDLKKLLYDYLGDRENDNMIGLDIHTIPYIEEWLKEHNRIVK
jgi:hypothetical protein